MITALSSAYFKSSGLPPKHAWRLRSASGHLAYLYGPIDISYKLADKPIFFPTFVADIPDDCLLGADFLHAFKGQIDMHTYKGKFTLPDDSSVILSGSETPPHPSCRLT